MRIFVDIPKQAIIRVDDEKRDIYKADNYADKIKVYCTERPPVVGETWYLELNALLSNGRATRGFFNTGQFSVEMVDGKVWYVMEFDLTKDTTLCQGLATFYLRMKFVNPASPVKKEKTIGSFNLNIINTTQLDENILIMDNQDGNVVLNMKAQIEEIAAALATNQANLLNKQDIDSVVIADELDNVTRASDIYDYFDTLKGAAPRVYVLEGQDTTPVTTALGLNNLIESTTTWTINFVLINADDYFKLAIIFRDVSKPNVYGMMMDSFFGADYTDTGWIDLTYSSQVKSKLESEINERKELVSQDGSNVYVGKEDKDLKIKSKSRPKVNTTEEMAYQSDVKAVDSKVDSTQGEVNTLKNETIPTLDKKIDDEIARSKNQDTATNQRITDDVNRLNGVDSGLQSQINALVSRSDVVDVVATYAKDLPNLVTYPVETITINDIVKVLKDETKDNAETYYKLKSISPVNWEYIGAIGESYTKEEQDITDNAQNVKIEANRAAIVNVSNRVSDVKANTGNYTKTLEDLEVRGVGYGVPQLALTISDEFKPDALIARSMSIKDKTGKVLETFKLTPVDKDDPIIKTLYDTKANIDGSYIGLTSGSTIQVVNPNGNPIDKALFSNRVTYNGSNFTVGPARMLKIMGNTISINQQAKSLENFTNYNGTYFVEYGIGHFTAERQYANVALTLPNAFTKGHKYYIKAYVKTTTPTTDIKMLMTNQDDLVVGTSTKPTTNWQLLDKIIDWQYDASRMGKYLSFKDFRSSGWDEFQIRSVMLVDLTITFGVGKEPIDTLDPKMAFLKNTFIPYNRGKLYHSRPKQFISIGKQQWDGTFISGKGILPDGNEYNEGSLNATNHILVIPNQTYTCEKLAWVNFYDGNKKGLLIEQNDNPTFKIPADAQYIRITFVKENTNDLMLNLGTEQDKYEPQEKSSITIPIDTYFESGYLAGTDSVRNEINQKDSINRLNVVTITPENSTIRKGNNDGGFVNTINFSIITKFEKPLGEDNFNNFKNNLFVYDYSNDDNEHIYCSNDGSNLIVILFINRSSLESLDVQGFTKWLTENPIELVYSIENPIVQPTIPFINSFKAVGNGTERWDDGENSVFSLLPVKSEIEYASDMAGKLSSLPTRPEYDETIANLVARIEALENNKPEEVFVNVTPNQAK